MWKTEQCVCRSGRCSLRVAVACLLLLSSALAAPSITLSKKVGPPTTEILVSGSGFAANVGVDIYFDTKDEALVVTNNEGEFHNAAAYAPRSAFPGEHWVTALERNNDKGDQEPFVVFTDWPQYHFDAARTGSNPYENVLNKHTVGGLQLRWESDGQWPAVSNGRVYVGSVGGGTYLYALNMATGSTQWSYKFDSTTYSGPAVSECTVYDTSIDSVDKDFHAFNADSGSTKWVVYLGQTYTSPAVDNKTVYVASSPALYALDAATGNTIWTYQLPLYSVNSSPAVGEGRVYAIAGSEELYALDAKSGALLWTYTSGDNTYFTNPAIANGIVYVGMGNTFYALNASNGTVLWTLPLGSTEAAITNGIVYFGSGGFLYAVDAMTGAQLWRFHGAQAINSQSVANEVVYANSYPTVYALDAETGQLLWSHPISCCSGYNNSPAPAIANGWLFAGGLQAFSLEDTPLDYLNETLAPNPSTLHPDLKLEPTPHTHLH
jgi:outer membrane protein assembly factor BamB